MILSIEGRQRRVVVSAVLIVVALYGLGCLFGWPQLGRDAVVGAAVETHAPAGLVSPHVVWVLPFVALLGCIAILPLAGATQQWWESNLHRFYVVIVLAMITLLYYLIVHQAPVDGHWPAHHLVEKQAGTTLQWNLTWTVLSNAIMGEYVPFIVLLLSLYTISGGIRIDGDLPAHPVTNTVFLATGALLASLIGTTGAAMLLIRPLLETNRERKHSVHTVIIFIFIVCNCGGCLLPIGDPPLFLGYLMGVDFFWTLHLWKEWLFINGALLAIYYLWDHFYYYPRETKQDIARDEAEVRPLTFSGWKINAPLLLGVVGCVALLDPSKPIPGTAWHPWLYLREICELMLVGISLYFGNEEVRRKNRFTFAAIIEVAVLFLGIFICMQPALEILNIRGSELPVRTPAQFFWASGMLSSVLDNAPTYLVFFETAKTFGKPTDLPVSGGYIESLVLAAISLGSVFMGAMTYIGNGPNFMVKALAEEAGVKMPSFFNYLKYSFGILLPLLLLTCLLFLL
ncbi:MAG: sodium:proton antiporter [Planctomycetia bacterium]|nr:sodium:proton antiporter [Planctomycetia bacterium]